MEHGKQMSSFSTIRDVVAKSTTSPNNLFGSFAPNTVPDMSSLINAYQNAKREAAAPDPTTQNNSTREAYRHVPKKPSAEAERMPNTGTESFNRSWWQGSYNY